MWKSLIVLYLIVCVQGEEEEWLKVIFSHGSVRARMDPAGLYIFSNIPYATVPSRSHKFEAPLPPPAWFKPLETPEKDIICPQVATQFVEDKVMQEQCLIANVFVPVTTKEKLPVVVYVHGGAFELGYGNLLSPKKFVKEHEAIVVTFNYRLGVHGFLCLGTNAVPGNAGMKDQLELLRWVNRNIASFGGNPEDVTLAGYSAGSMSVHLLMLAKPAQGLFNKVILESGVSISASVKTDPLVSAKELARKLNFTDVDDIYALEQFFKSTPLELLLGSTSPFTDKTDASVAFGPCVERKTSSAFLSEAPINIIKNKDYNKVPILIGFSNFEGLLLVDKFETWKNKMNEKFSDFLPADLEFEDEIQKEEVAKFIKKFYFGEKTVSEDTILAYIDYFSDIIFIYPTLRSVKLHAESGHQEIYLYEYSFVDNNTPLVPHTKVRGATHCYQTYTIFDGVATQNITDETLLSQEFIDMKKTMRELWNNFVRHGKPVPEGSSLPSWPSAGVDCSPHMSLSQTIELRGSLVESRARFWDGIYHKYYREPTPPPKPPHTEL